MPQMMPMYWIFMFFLLTILMMMSITFTYFFYPYYTPKKSFQFIIYKSWSWKW